MAGWWWVIKFDPNKPTLKLSEVDKSIIDFALSQVPEEFMARDVAKVILKYYNIIDGHDKSIIWSLKRKASFWLNRYVKEKRVRIIDKRSKGYVYEKLMSDHWFYRNSKKV
mgnify:CR=1 FL=1